MRKASVFINVLIALILSSSCTERKDQNAIYFPCSVGSKWEFAVKANQPVGVSYVKTGKTIIYSTNEWKSKSVCDSQEVINGKKYYKFIISTNLPGSEIDKSYMRISKDGVYDIYDNNEFIIVPFPLTKGKTWNYVMKGRSKGVKGTFIGYEDLLTTEKEYKNCLVVEYEYLSDLNNCYYKQKVYYAPNVGAVKTITENITHNLFVESNLSHYTK